MEPTIEELIEAGKNNLIKARTEEQRLAQAMKAFEEEQAIKLKTLAFENIPTALWTYARVTAEHCLWIELPDCAPVNCALRVVTSSQCPEELGGKYVTSVEAVHLVKESLGGGWEVLHWKLFRNDDGEWDGAMVPISSVNLDALEDALALAAEVGDNEAKIAQDVIARNEELRKKDVTKPAPVEKLLICPLMQSPDDDEWQKCVGARCALWITGNGLNACSLKILALNGLGLDNE